MDRIRHWIDYRLKLFSFFVLAGPSFWPVCVNGGLDSTAARFRSGVPQSITEKARLRAIRAAPMD